MAEAAIWGRPAGSADAAQSHSSEDFGLQKGYMRLSVLLLSILVLPLATGPAAGQQLPPGVTKEQALERLANDNPLFLQVAKKALKWEVPAEPVQIAEPLYFVGTEGLGAFLFNTSDGLVLMNTGMPSSGPMIEANIKKLGFKPTDIRLMINGHGHTDHAGAFAYMKRLAPQATLAIMDKDVAKLESGGKGDFKYGDDFAYEPVKVDRVLHDGDRIRMGNVVFTALWTPGHTEGATTWLVDIVDHGRPYLVAFPDGAGFNPGYRLVKNPSYPGIADDYRNTQHILEMLKPDLWLAQHNEYYDLAGKTKRAKTEGLAAWMDAEGYRKFIASKKRAFEDQVDKELAVQPAAN